MTASGDHVTIPKLLLWGIAVSILTGLGGGGFWLGELSQRVATLEQNNATIGTVNSRLDTVNQRLTAIEERLRFVIQHDFPGQQGMAFSPPYSDRADK